jgi:hypothetical protein
MRSKAFRKPSSQLPSGGGDLISYEDRGLYSSIASQLQEKLSETISENQTENARITEGNISQAKGRC